jgi:hypothetical protein
MPSTKIKYLLLAAPVLLSACGPDFQPERVQGIVPYVMERTAGTGVAYVRARMMQEKSLVVETKTEAPAVVEPPKEEPLKSAEPVFNAGQKK